MHITLTQARQLKENGYCFRDLIEAVESLPAWLYDLSASYYECEQDNVTPFTDIADIMAIVEGGCASGAYMPAVTYWHAKQCFIKHEDELLDLVDCFEGDFLSIKDGLSSLAVRIVSYAVESIANQLADDFDLHSVEY